MIGRDDVQLPTNGLSLAAALDAVVRIIRRRWRAAVIQDVRDGHVFGAFASIPFGVVDELLVYRDMSAYSQWESLGAVPTTAGSMIHALVTDGYLTLVVDDRDDATSSGVIREIENFLAAGHPGRIDADVAKAA